jgi:hypothetical protein
MTNGLRRHGHVLLDLTKHVPVAVSQQVVPEDGVGHEDWQSWFDWQVLGHWGPPRPPSKAADGHPGAVDPAVHGRHA